MRAAYGLFRLCDRCGAPRVDALCARAIAFDVPDVGRIERMLGASPGSSPGHVGAVPGASETSPPTTLTAEPRRFGGLGMSVGRPPRFSAAC
jgi:hypothetical protein